MTGRPNEGPRSTPPSAPTDRGRGRDAALLAASALVLLLAGGAGSAASSADASAISAVASADPRLPTLPTGAEPRATQDDEVRADDEGVGCSFPEHGFGDYERWRPLSLGRVLVPGARAVRDDGTFNLLVHFHGAEPVRKELAPERMDLVVAAVDAGAGSSKYEHALAHDGSFEALLASIEREVAIASGRPDAHVGHLAVSSWSAGYGAVAQILARPHDKVEAVLLLDSLYASYQPGRRALEHGQVAPFVRAARSASEGGPLFFLTTTEIDTNGYASSSETAAFLLRELGARPTPVSSTSSPTEELSLLRSYDRGALFVRGYAGKGSGDHCAQLRLLPGLLRRRVLPAFAP